MDDGKWRITVRAEGWEKPVMRVKVLGDLAAMEMFDNCVSVASGSFGNGTARLEFKADGRWLEYGHAFFKDGSACYRR